MIVFTQTVYTDPSHASRQGYLARPDDDRTHPGIVLIQEWWGVEPHVRDVAERIAREGFVVLVPDLYAGRIANEPDDAQKLMMATVQHMDRAIQEIILALNYLRNNVGVRPKKLGLMGFCMGGLLAFKTAARYEHLGALSPWYGGMYDPSPEDVAKVTAPVLAIYGEHDRSIPVPQVRKIEGLYKAAGKDAQFIVYPGAGHAFLNPDHGMYVESAAKDAWAKAMAFFKARLT